MQASSSVVSPSQSKPEPAQEVVPLARFCDLCLPVPLDRPFTYELPETMRHRVKVGCRLLAPFGPRSLAGIAVEVHDRQPEVETRQVLRLLDEEPVLDDSLIALGRWISGYYCAPLGEVLRAMTPLSGELRHSRMWSLTDRGRDAIRQLVLSDDEQDASVELLRMLETRSLSASYLAKKIAQAPRLLKALAKRDFVEVEDAQVDRDPLRAAANRLRVEFAMRPAEGKLTRAERELLAFLELHPGAHNLEKLEPVVKGASSAARALARRGLVTVQPEPVGTQLTTPRPPHELNVHQQQAFDRIRAAIDSRQYQAFLLKGVTGSGAIARRARCR